MKEQSKAGVNLPELWVYVCREDCLMPALAFGADRIIIDTPRTRIATRSDFDLKSLEAAHNRARRLGKGISVWFPILPKPRQAAEIASVAASIARIGIGSAIVRDPFVLTTLSGRGLKHFVLDPETPVSNAASASFWQAQGISEWFPPFDSSTMDLKDIYAESGGRGFATICLAGMDYNGTPDFCTTTLPHSLFSAIEAISNLFDWGARKFVAFPPEQSQLAVAVFTRALRNCLNEAAVRTVSPRKLRRYKREIESVSRLSVSKGFLPGFLHRTKRASSNLGALLDAEVIGAVKEFFAEQGRARVILQGNIKVGDDVTVVTPNGDYKAFIGAATLMDGAGHALERAEISMLEEISVFLPRLTPSNSLLIRTKD